jgi:hypothetical protein
MSDSDPVWAPPRHRAVTKPRFLMKTVRQLIQELQKLPQDAEVVVLGQGASEGCECVPQAVMRDSGWLSGKVLIGEE